MDGASRRIAADRGRRAPQRTRRSAKNSGAEGEQRRLLQLAVSVALFLLVLMGYSVFKTFFANLKRGGILLIQIAVGSLYLFSVPRGYTDGFYSWCRQVAGLCLTAFMQTTMLIAGLMVCNSNLLLGLGLMLSASEVPRIAQQFGLDTSAKANIMSAVYTTQTVVNLSRSLIAAIK